VAAFTAIVGIAIIGDSVALLGSARDLPEPLVDHRFVPKAMVTA